MTQPGTGDAGRGIAALLVTSLLWGTTGTAAAFLPDAVPAPAIGAATMGIGGVVLALTAPRRVRAVLADRRNRGPLITGALAVVAYPLAFYSGMHLAGVAIGNVVALGSAPAIAAALEALLDRRRPSRAWVLSTVVAVLGVALLAAGGGTDAGPDVPLGVALGLGAGFAYALYTIASGRLIRRGADSRGVMGAVFGLGALPLLALLAVVGAPLLHAGSALWLVGYLALGPMALAYVLFGLGLRSVGGSTATTITLLEPVVATVLAVAVLGERLGALGWVGAALVLVALVVVVSASRGARRAGHP